MSKRVVAIIQARMGSLRLPGKVLADIGGRPMLGRVVDRLRKARSLDQLIVATSTEAVDEPIARFCAESGVSCFRGHPNDVLDRFFRAAQVCHAETVVRVTADCPLLDPLVIDQVVAAFAPGEWDYASNTIRSTYPDGLDVEVFTFAALEKAWRESKDASDREHVTPYLRNSGLFRTLSVENPMEPSASGFRWTVDEAADLEFVRLVYQRMSSPDAGWEEVVHLLSGNPELQKVNRGFVRNEGYYRTLVQDPPTPPLVRSLERSLVLKEKARKLIPSCSQTLSKSPSQFVQGVAPVFLSSGQGCHVYDVDNNEYIDHAMALGSVILGHNDPDVTESVTQQMAQGVVFSLPHPLEVKLAELLVELIPCAEMVRFGKNGSDATAGAVRLARAYTGRDVIACCGYHGWQDWFIGTTTRNRGVPKTVQGLTVPFTYNDLESLKRVFKDYPDRVAAVIMEPMGVIKPSPGFLENVLSLSREQGALLIFDEVVTGFRFAMGGAQEYFGVTPDLACFGKALGNGYPISAVVGRREVMELFEDVFFSFTLGGETLSLAAALAVLHKLRTQKVIAHLWTQGEKLQDGFNVLSRLFGLERHMRCDGLSPRTVITFQDKEGAESLLLKSLFQQECLKRGILFTGAQNVCFSHTDGDVERTLKVYRAAMEIVAHAIRDGDAERRLEGALLQPVFRKP